MNKEKWKQLFVLFGFSWERVREDNDIFKNYYPKLFVILKIQNKINHKFFPFTLIAIVLERGESTYSIKRSYLNT